ncbi:uncharacterized protein LOC134321266 isoform X2 [Trichomycterus rosablanca]|uniref:uncharacterized protein LOC134321266 isoform X2 n=1 Tax=Trichomycterus rosablanca TaxID=2290929 RepID=UPI002F35BF17
MPRSSFQQAADQRPTGAKRDLDTAYDQTTTVQTINALPRPTPMHRRGSAPLPCTASPSVGNNTPKYRSSITSITMTSRRVTRSSSLPDTNFPTQIGSRSPSPMALNNKHIGSFRQAPQRKAIAVKITEQREVTRRIVQPKAKNGHAYRLPFRSNTIDNDSPCFSNIYNRRSPDPAFSRVDTIENHNQLTVRENHIPTLFDIYSKECYSPLSINQTTVDTHQPVVLRKKNTIIKAMEHKENHNRGTNEDGRILNYRHSYTEGFKATSSQAYQNCPSSIEDTESGSAPRLVHSDATNKKVTERYKSSLSLKLKDPSIPSFKEPLMNKPHPNRRPRRPASCHATLFSPAEHSVNASKDPKIQSRRAASPHETNIDHSSFTGSSSNRCLNSEGGPGSHEKINLRRARSASNVGQSDIPGNQHFTLIKVPESSTHETYDAIMALNAAAVIANIKLQSQQKKKTQTHGSTNNKKDSASQSKTARCRAEETHTDNQGGATFLSITTPETAAPVKPWHVEFVPLATTDELSSYSCPLSKALEQQRPDFIRRSQARVQAVEKRAQKRQHLLNKQTPAPKPAQKPRDNMSKSRNQNTLGKQMQSQLRRNDLPEVKRMKEEEKRKMEEEKRISIYKTNRLRAELFKKKVLDQVLRRGKM